MHKEDFYIRFEDIVVSLLELRVWLRGQETHFSVTELRLLLALLAEPYKTIPTAELIRLVSASSSSDLYRLISVVRVKLDQRYIVNQRRHGYSFADCYREVKL